MMRKKTGGRVKGVQNKYTYATKEVLSHVVNAELNHLIESLKNMSDLERANIVIRLLPFVIPKDAASVPDDIVYTMTLS
jgi:hypothetical protein